MGKGRKNKVLSSPHFNEIHARLCEGESARSVSKWLKETYGEKISHAALNRYNNDYIKMEDKVEVEANKILATKISEPFIQNEVAKKVEAEVETRTVATETAELLIGLTRVAKNYPEDYEQMKLAVNDPDSKVTEKDVAQMSQQANKIVLDYNKNQDSTVEVNLENNFSRDFNEEKIRKILDAKRNREK